ncbi:PDZ domain-containing protein [Cytophagaceae bacterium YF14B1]|uniref:PDZ domain-containing protein n=1 Tax=Xanthocytophaga flava TaxID=3048013 RepID=A0AAE3QSE9_9BACT|nr:PDZ domain-containing protein [Xanthocytophaga flavus]MDJ1484572.1 PDZ domain-containing protein [Xanthocytophaga flavus]
MKKTLVSVFTTFFIACVGYCQSAIYYRVSFPNAIHHEAEITANFSGLSSQPLIVRMSRSSPGRYATHEFGKNIYNLKATDANGNYIPVNRLESDLWEIPKHGTTVNILYTLFGNLVDGTYAGIDETHAHLNMPASFLWAKGLESAPISITFDIPDGSNWKVATQLKPAPEPNTFSAPNLQYFMDSPTELSNFTLKEWTITNTDKKPLTIRLALHHDGTDENVTTYAPMVQKVVQEAGGVFGEWPSYDYGTYTFIQDVFPDNDGDGMEHRNSTFITDAASFKGNPKDFLGTVSHEFFHCWNVERIRPKSLEPFNFEHSNMSSELWFAEGFTSYYGELILRRAGFYDNDQYVQSLSGQLNYVLNSPGTYRFSPVEMSQQAPFVDAASYVDPVNFANTYTSYYPYGCVVGLALDLSLRTKFKNLTLDDFMKAVWQAQGKPEKPYTVLDIQTILGQVTKDTAFANTFFRKHVTGHEVADYQTLLGKMGLLLRKARPNEAFFGRNLKGEQGQIIVRTGTQINTPLYNAGIDQGDIILSVENTTVTDTKNLDDLIKKHKPGDVVNVQYNHKGAAKTTQVTLSENPQLEIVTYEKAGMKTTKDMLALRDNWLKSKALP